MNDYFKNIYLLTLRLLIQNRNLMKVLDFQIILGMVDFRIISPDVNILSLRSQGFALFSIPEY